MGQFFSSMKELRGESKQKNSREKIGKVAKGGVETICFRALGAGLQSTTTLVVSCWQVEPTHYHLPSFLTLPGSEIGTKSL